GPVAGARIVADEDHIIMISDRGKLIRVRASDISVLGRATQGVRMMRLEEGERVASLERLAEGQEDDKTAGGAVTLLADAGDTERVDMGEVIDEPDDGGGDDDDGAPYEPDDEDES
ncbi:MAG TPA: DNA gyrase C-terminal beta-propeller domain-containing protein, partial [Kofleriaceae bacterium]|nr:DNA gyrase C-terminal beta-propeller domain-containing protein [Kofleriaceae bacterium]